MNKRKLRWRRFLCVLFVLGVLLYASSYAILVAMPELFAAGQRSQRTLLDLPQEYRVELEEIKAQYPQDERVDHMIQNYDAYPVILFTLLNTNKDAFTYVYEYPLHKEKRKQYELDKEELSSGMPYLYQWDERWGYHMYGEDMLGLTGCAPTALAMIMSYLKEDTAFTPDRIARYSEQMGYYSNGQGTRWQLFYDYANQHGVHCEDVSIQREAIRAALLKNRVILMSMGVGDFTTSGHLIVVSGIDEEGNMIVHDPNSATRSQLHWEIDRLLSQCMGAWEFY